MYKRFFVKQMSTYNKWCFEKPFKSSVINTFSIMSMGDLII